MTPEHRAEYIRAALHRALTWAEDHPSDGPLLGETPQTTTCQRGHPLPNGGRCKECRNAARRARYAEVKA